MQHDDLHIDTYSRLEPISSLAPDQIAELVRQSAVEQLDAGVELFHEGDPAAHTIYLLRGDLALTARASGEQHTISGGSPEACHPVADENPRRYSAIATTVTEIIRIDKELLDTLLTWGQISAPEEDVVMSPDGIITINKADWLKTMIKSPNFRHLPPANIEELLHRLEPVVVHAGDVIVKQGDVGDYFYMIDEGTALVTRNPDNDEDSIEMAELNKGASFGEAALITDNPRNATVTMMSDGILLRLSKEDFNKLLKHPTLHWMGFADASAQVEQGAEWIDVRLASEFEHAHLPGARHIPMQALHRQARELDTSRAYICYCQTGRRSSAAAFVLSQYGLKASVLEGGLAEVPSAHMTAPQTRHG
jgi:CRP-like cAMP-binding protein